MSNEGEKSTMDETVEKEDFDKEGKEKELNGMVIDRLRQIARQRKLTSTGDKSTLVERILGDMIVGDTVAQRISTTYGVLEEAIMAWTAKEQRTYLQGMKCAIYGSKAELTARIMAKVSIDHAVKITREHTRKINATNKESKEKEAVRLEEVTDVEMKDMELALKRKRTVRKDIEEMPPPAPPKKVHGTTADRDTSVTAAPRGGNALLNVEDDGVTVEEVPAEVRMGQPKENAGAVEVDEAGWRQKGRVNARDDEDVASVQTQITGNIKRTRMGFMVTMRESKDPDKQLSILLQKWFIKMKEVDAKFFILPWKVAERMKPAIRDVKKIPNMMSKIKTYFSRAQVRSNGGKVYTDVYVQHSIPIEDIKGDSEWFLRENKMGMYNKELQVESTEQKGWLLYSTRTLDHELLAESIEAEIGVKVALRWKFINTEKYESDGDERKKWMATHIEVDATDGKKASRGLARLYGSQSKTFPLGIRMRLVSEFREVKGNTTMMSKHTRLRVRQASFSALISGHPSDDIQLLDYEDGGITLRSLIMGIESRNPSTPGNLFHAVGKDWKGRIIFNFLKNKSDEATMIIDGLIPYLHFHHGASVYQFFDPEAVIDKEEWRWDDDKGTIVNPLSIELDGLEAIDDDYNLSAVSEASSPPIVITANSNDIAPMTAATPPPQTAEQLALTRMNMIVTGGSNDSVSTLGNPMSPANVARNRKSMLLPATEVLPPTAASVSDCTMDSRVSAIEERMSTMESSIKQSFADSMQQLLEKISASSTIQTTSQPPGGESAGGKDE